MARNWSNGKTAAGIDAHSRRARACGCRFERRAMTLASEGVAKIIVCDVAPDERRRFDRTQRRWGAVAHCAGLVGQCGGWSREERARAVIFAYWNNRDFYDAFMKAEHDAVAVRQRGAYESAAIALSSDIVPIADDDPPRLSTTLRTATFARRGLPRKGEPRRDVRASAAPCMESGDGDDSRHARRLVRPGRG